MIAYEILLHFSFKMKKSAKKAKIDLLNEELLIEKLKVLPPREYHKKLAEFNNKDWLTSIVEPLIPDLKGKYCLLNFRKVLYKILQATPTYNLKLMKE